MSNFKVQEGFTKKHLNAYNRAEDRRRELSRLTKKKVETIWFVDKNNPELFFPLAKVNGDWYNLKELSDSDFYSACCMSWMMEEARKEKQS